MATAAKRTRTIIARRQDLIADLNGNRIANAGIAAHGARDHY